MDFKISYSFFVFQVFLVTVNFSNSSESRSYSSLNSLSTVVSTEQYLLRKSMAQYLSICMICMYIKIPQENLKIWTSLLLLRNWINPNFSVYVYMLKCKEMINKVQFYRLVSGRPNYVYKSKPKGSRQLYIRVTPSGNCISLVNIFSVLFICLLVFYRFVLLQILFGFSYFE